MTSPRAPVIGLPTFRLSSWASSSLCSLMQGGELGERPAALARGPVRPALAVLERGLRGGDGPVDVLAAAERRGGHDARRWPGSTTSNVWPSAASTRLAADDHAARRSVARRTGLDRGSVVMGWTYGCEWRGEGAPMIRRRRLDLRPAGQRP